MGNSYERVDGALGRNLNSSFQAGAGNANGMGWRYDKNAYGAGNSQAAHIIGVNVVRDRDVQAFFDDMNMRSGGRWTFDIDHESNGVYLPSNQAAALQAQQQNGRYAAMHRGQGTPHTQQDAAIRKQILDMYREYQVDRAAVMTINDPVERSAAMDRLVVKYSTQVENVKVFGRDGMTSSSRDGVFFFNNSTTDGADTGAGTDPLLLEQYRAANPGVSDAEWNGLSVDEKKARLNTFNQERLNEVDGKRWRGTTDSEDVVSRYNRDADGLQEDYDPANRDRIGAGFEIDARLADRLDNVANKGLSFVDKAATALDIISLYYTLEEALGLEGLDESEKFDRIVAAVENSNIDLGAASVRDFLVQFATDVAVDIALSAAASMLGVGLLWKAYEIYRGFGGFREALALAAEKTKGKSGYEALEIADVGMQAVEDTLAAIFDNPDEARTLELAWEQKRAIYESLPELLQEKIYEKMNELLGGDQPGGWTFSSFKQFLNEVEYWAPIGKQPDEFLQDLLIKSGLAEGLDLYKFGIDSCFEAGTPVLMADGSVKSIEDVEVGDWVAAFDGGASGGRGDIVPRQVTRLFRNTTRDWVELTDSDQPDWSVRLTPGHMVLSETGDFLKIADLLRLGGGHARLVDTAGEIRTVSGRVISNESDLECDGLALGALVMNGAALMSSAASSGWQTYNFEVEGLHTYVAAGLRVHNDSLLAFAPDGMQFVSATFNANDQIEEATFRGIANGDPIEVTTFAGGRDQHGTILDFIKQTQVGDNVTVEATLHVDGSNVVGHEITKLEIDDIDATGDAATLGALMNTLGSTLGSFIVGDNLFAQIGVNTLVGTVTQNIAESVGVLMDGTVVSVVGDYNIFDNANNPVLKRVGPVGTSELVTEAWSDFGLELVDNFARSAVSAFSSLLLVEAADALGLEGFGGDLFQTVGGTVTSHISNAIFDNVFHSGAGAPDILDAVGSFNNFGVALSGAVGALAGRYIAKAFVSADSEAEAIGQQIGSALGSVVGTTIIGPALASAAASVAPATAAAIGIGAGGAIAAGSLGAFIIPGIGALIGVVLGTVLGDLLGGLFDDGPKTATVTGELNAEFNQFELVGLVKDGLSPQVARQIVSEFAGSANAVIRDIEGYVAEGEGIRFTLTMSDRDPHVLTIYDAENDHTVGISSHSVQELATVGTVLTLFHTRFADGDTAKILALEAWKQNLLDVAGQTGQLGLFVKGESGGLRDASVFQNAMAELIQNFSAVADYETFTTVNSEGVENSQAILALMQAESNSAFAAGWAISLMQFEQIGLFNGVDFTADDRDNRLLGTMNSDIIHGEGGDDIIVGKRGDNVLYGGAGEDQLSAEDGDDTMFGGVGVDAFWAGSGNAWIYGGEDEDLITFRGNVSDYEIRDHNGNILGYGAPAPGNDIIVEHLATGDIATVWDVEFVRFHDDVLTFDPSYDTFLVGDGKDNILEGTVLRDAINGLGGNDIIFGFEGADALFGGLGDDTLFGGLGDDWVFGVLGNDVLYGGPDDDALYGGGDFDIVWGDEDNDRVYGGNGDDVVNGNDGNDSVFGNRGDDLIEGGGGNDTLEGAGADDIMFGGDGADSISGGTDDDVLFGGKGNDLLRGGWGDDEVHGGDGDDTIIDGVLSSGFPDSGGGDDLIFGGNGNDSIFGGWSDDVVYGGAGNDKIFALRHAETENPFTYVGNIGGAMDYYNESGQDTAYGGAGHDQISLNSETGGAVFGGDGNDFTWIRNEVTDARIDGGAGHDKVRIFATKFIDVMWYRDTSTGETAGEIWYRGFEAPQQRKAYIKNVEEVITSLGQVLREGYTFNNGYGNGRDHAIGYTGYHDMATATFQGRFSDEAFAEQQFTSATQDRLITSWQTVPTTSGSFTPAYPGAHRLYGREGNETIYAESGDDQVKARAGNDAVFGGRGDDSLWGEDGADSINGGSGKDALYGGVGQDKIFGGNGSDHIWGEAGDDILDGGNGNDVVYGGAGHDDIGNGRRDDGAAYLTSGRDRLYGEEGNDTLHGGASPDALYGGLGNDRLAGGDGSDEIFGGNGSDTAWGGNGFDEMHGGDGADTMHGGAADDALYGGVGIDELYGGDGDDVIDAGNGDDVVNGGDGRDRLDGGSGLDKLSGDGGDDTIFGGSERDSLWGGNDNDAVYGGEGDDRLWGSNGDDALFGGDGIDDLRGGNNDDLLHGGFGNDFLKGEAGDDLISGDLGNDRSYGGDGNDVLIGGIGTDSSYGGNGDDTLVGSSGSERLQGDAGADVIFDGDGATYMYGGSGTDRFILKKDGIRDYIYDFNPSTEKIDFSAWHVSDLSDLSVSVSGSWLIVRHGDEEQRVRIEGSATPSTSMINDTNTILMREVYASPVGGEIVISRQDEQSIIVPSSDAAMAGARNVLVFRDLSLSEMTVEEVDMGGDFGKSIKFSWAEGSETRALFVAGEGAFLEGYRFADGTTLDRILADYLNATHSGGNAERDQMFGTGEDDLIIGTSGSDVILGRNGDDTLDAGPANGGSWQYLYGEHGNDTYLIGRDNGNVFAVRDASGTDRIVFTDLAMSDVSFSFHDYGEGTYHDKSLIISWDIDGLSGQVRISQMGNDIESFEFADGSTLSRINANYLWASHGHLPAGERDIVYGSSEGDVIRGSQGPDYVWTGAGDDILSVGGNNTTDWQYLFGGDGNDLYLIERNNKNVFIAVDGAGTDQLHFADLALTDLTFEYSDYGTSSPHGLAVNMAWNVDGESGQARLAQQGKHFDSISFADGVSVTTVLHTLVDGTQHPNHANMRYMYGTAGDDLMIGYAGRDQFYGGDGNDILDVGQSDGGWESVSGGNGNDTYLYAKQNGRVAMSHNLTSGEGADTGDMDRVIFTDLDYQDLDPRLLAYHSAAGDRVEFYWNDGSAAGMFRIPHAGQFIEEYQFSDGLTASNLMFTDLAGVDHSALPGTKYMYGSAEDDLMIGGDYNVHLYGGEGNDLIDPGAGASTGGWQRVDGGNGSDTYFYAKESGYVTVSAAEDADSGVADRIVFKDLKLDDLTINALADHPTVGVRLDFTWSEGGATGVLRVTHDADYIEFFEFADGTVLTNDELIY